MSREGNRRLARKKTIIEGNDIEKKNNRAVKSPAVKNTQKMPLKSLKKRTSDSFYKELYSAHRDIGLTFSDSRKFSYYFPVLDIPVENNSGSILLRSKNAPERTVDSHVAFDSGLFLSCLHASSRFICVGVKSHKTPLNIFEIKTGKSTVLIFDTDLNLLKTVEEEYGDVLDVKIMKDLFVLFCNGNLIKYTISNINSNSTAEIKCIKTILEKERKVVAFDVQDDILVYSDGRNITVNGITKGYDGLIVDLKIYKGRIMTLDVNGKIHGIDPEMSRVEEIITKYTISGMQVVEDALIVFEDRKHSIVLGCDGKKLLGFFEIEEGTMTYWKHYRKRRKMKRMGAVYRENGDVYFMKGDGGRESENIIGVAELGTAENGSGEESKEAERAVVFCTEDGLIVKLGFF